MIGWYYINSRKKYSINFTENNKKFHLSLHYNAATPLCLGNISEGFSLDNMKRAGLNGHVYDCSVDYDPIAVDDTLDIHKRLKKKNDIV